MRAHACELPTHTSVAPTQLLLAHTALHTVPQPPQCCELLAVSTQVPPQSSRPPVQTQPPAVHVWLASQTVPHAPQ
jgi:hypothetical protein